MTKVAIIAHYDPECIWSENFIVLLQVVSSVIDNVIVVTTCENITDLPCQYSNLTLIRRPNVGYDFYSYRVGVYLALSRLNTTSILILNSSLLLLNTSAFQSLLLDLINKNSSILSLTDSLQISWHPQSYLLYFNQSCLSSAWLWRFFNEIEPVNSKFEVIVRYEIGLGQVIQKYKASCDTLFKPRFSKTFLASLVLFHSLTRKYGLKVWLHHRPWSVWREINWAHFGAEVIAKRFGIVKAEFLRSNPHQLPQKAVWDSCQPELRSDISNTLLKHKKLYQPSSSGLTELDSSQSLGVIREIIPSTRHKKTNVNIAIVIHLFYLDLLDEILDYLDNITDPFEIFISTPFEADIPVILDTVDYRKKYVTIILTKNQGRDVGPFISLFQTGLLDKYEVVLKLHSKKSKYSEQGILWRHRIYTSLCGNSLTVLKSIDLLRRKGCGLIGPSRYFLTHPDFWGANQNNLMIILRSCGIKPEVCKDLELAFFAGTMFWFQPSALASIHQCRSVATLCFEPEGGEQDGLLAHAWERAFCLLVRESGHNVSSIELRGQDIFTFDNSKNRVPVLKTQ